MLHDERFVVMVEIVYALVVLVIYYCIRKFMVSSVRQTMERRYPTFTVVIALLVALVDLLCTWITYGSFPLESSSYAWPSSFDTRLIVM